MNSPDSLRLIVSDALRQAERNACNHVLPERRRAAARRLVHRLDEVLDELRLADEEIADEAAEIQSVRRAHQRAMGWPGASTATLSPDVGARMGQ